MLNSSLGTRHVNACVLQRLLAIYFLPQMEMQPLTKEMFKNKQAQRYREQTGGCQRQGVRSGGNG